MILSQWLLFGGNQVMDGRIDLDVLVSVEQAGVVDLPGEGAFLAGGGIGEDQVLDGFRADGLGDGHPRGPLFGSDEDLRGN